MQAKKHLFIFIGILGIIAALVGYILMYTEKRTEQIKEVEVELSKRIISEYEGVKTIKFKKWGHSKETGMWYIVAKVNDNEEISFSLSKISVDSVDSLVMDNDFSLKERSKNLDSDNISLKDYHITYSVNYK